MKKIMLVCVALLVLVAFVSPASARGAKATPYCTVIPNPVPQYSRYEITGGNYRPTEFLFIILTSPLRETYILNTFSDSQGFINQDAYINPEYGTKFNDELGVTMVQVYYQVGSSPKLAASCSFTVQ